MRKLILSATIICLVFGMVLFSLASNKNEPDYRLVFENVERSDIPTPFRRTTERPPDSQKNLSEDSFGRIGDEILSFHITVAEEDWLKMWDRPFRYVKCTVGFGDEVYQDVGLRFKGNSSASVRGLKKSYKFKFDEFDKKQRFHGFKKLNFQNGFKDPSLLREKLAYDLFEEAGVPAPRATFAKLYLTIEGHYDDEYLGLYTLVEQVDKVFLNDRFSDTSGNLFKCEGMFDLVYKGDFPGAYIKEYEAKLKKKQRDFSVLIRFIKMLNETPEEKFEEEIEKAFDVENFLSWLAVNTLLSNLDSYAGTGHNYYLYYNKSTGKFEFIPWDLNEAFGNFQMGSAQDMMELDIYEPYAKPKILIERILSVPKFKERYIEKIKSLLDGPFQQSVMYQKIDALYKKIEKDVRADMWKDFTTEDFERSIEHHIQPQQRPQVNLVIGLKPFVTERIKSVKAQLAGKKRGFVPRPSKPPPFGDFPPPKAFIELARQLEKAEELIDKDAKQAVWVIEHATGALKNLGKRVKGQKGMKMDEASKQLYAIYEEIAQSVQAVGGLSARRMNEIKKFLRQTHRMVQEVVPPPMPDELLRKVDELHRLMEKKMNEGIDISEAKKLDDKSKEYAQRGDMKGAINLISKAIDLLKD